MAVVVTAVHTFVAEHDDELEFQAGDKITVIEKDEAFGDGWWRGRNTKGEEGLFPATYITESADASAAAPPGSADAPPTSVGGQEQVAPVDAPGAAAAGALGSAKGPNGSVPESAPIQDSIPPPSQQQVPAAAAAVPAPAASSGPANGMNGVANHVTDPSVAAQDDEDRKHHSLLDESGAPRSAVTANAGQQKSGVMNPAINDVEEALEEHIASSPSSTRGLKNFETDRKADGLESRDQTDDEGGMGITSDARARLAEQAKLANEERERHAQRESGGVAGLIYSDESDDDDDSHHSRRGSGINGDHSYHHQPSGLAGIARGNSSGGSFPHGGHGRSEQLPPVMDAEDYDEPYNQQQQHQQQPPHLQQQQQQQPYQSYQRSPEPTAAPVLPQDQSATARAPTGNEAIPPAPHHDGGLRSAEQTPEMHSGSTMPATTAAAGAGTIAGVTAAAAAAAAYRQNPNAEPYVAPSTNSNDSQGRQSPALTPSVRSSSLPSNSPLVKSTALPPTPSPQKGGMAPLPVTGSAPGSAHGTPHTDAVEQLQPALPLPPTPSNPALASAQSPTQAATPVTPGTAARMPKTSPNTWTVTDVVEWAHSRGFDQSVCDKFIEHDISGDVLLELDANLLKELDIPQFGKRIRIAQAINELRRPASHGSANSLHQGGVDQSHGRSPSMPPSAYTSSVYGGSTAGTSVHPDDQQGSWGGSHSRKVSTTPSTQPIDESRVADVHSNANVVGIANINANGGSHHSTPLATPHTSTASAPTPQRSSGSTPVSPSTTVIKRESSGSLGHKKGKSSLDKSDRLSFFGRARKPPPAQAPGSQNGPRLPFSKQSMSTIPADRPEKRISSNGTQAPVGGALQKIGKPDKTGYLKKRGERYNTWKQRFFVLKGSHLYYLKSENEDRVKGHIDLKGHRIIVDESTNPGNYGFRLVGPGNEKVHYFSWPERTQIRDWMKALMKATIARDYSVPVTSSCNIPTIPLAEAQAMQPRPPSPSEREAVQRANRRENANQLTPRDASVLMALDTTGSGGKLMSGHMSLMPSRPSRDMRRASTGRSSNGGRPISSAGVGGPRPNSTGRPSIASYYPPDDDPNPQAADLMQWVNRTLPPQYPRVAHWPNSFVSGEVIFLIVKHLAGLEPVPPVPASAFSPDQSGLANVDGLFAMMDIVIDAGIDSAGVSLNDIRAGDAHAITQLLQGVRSWAAARGFP